MEGIIFDLDGLLVNTEPLHRQAWQETLRKYGVTLSDLEYDDRWIRKGEGIESYTRVIRLPVPPLHLREHKRVRYYELLNEVNVFPGARGALILAQAYKTGLCSSSWRADVQQVLCRTGMEFPVVVTGNDVTHKKPHPEGFLLTARRMNVAPRDCLVFEDAQKGVEAAVAAGMMCIAVPNDLTRDNDFSQAANVLETLEQVTKELLEGFK